MIASMSSKVSTIVLAIATAIILLPASPASAAYYEGGVVSCGSNSVYTAATTYQTTYHYAPKGTVQYAAYHSAYQFHFENTGYGYVSSWRIDASAFSGSGSVGCT